MNILPTGWYESWPVVGVYPTPTVVKATITGGAAATPWDDWTFTEKGYHSNCGTYTILLSSPTWSDCGTSAYRTVTGTVQLMASVYPMPAGCNSPTNPNPGHPDCPTFSGGFDAEQDRLDADLIVTPTDATPPGGMPAVITWRASPDSVGGIKTPLSAKRVFFEPDGDGTPADSAVTCQVVGGYYYQTNSCTIAPQGSGTLHIWAIVNGKLVHKTAHITVPTLQMSATPGSGVSGTPITFTPVWSDGTAVTQAPNWLWSPDSGLARTSACGWASTRHACTTPVYESGTMTAIITVNGIARSASAHVNINKCPNTGDSTIDSPDVRAGFLDMMRKSNPDSSPSAGYDPVHGDTVGTRHEEGVWIVKRSDGSYYTVPAQGVSTSCSFSPSSPSMQLPDGSTIVALAHTHPMVAGDSVFGHCQAYQHGKSESVKRFPGDDEYNQGYAGSDWSGGGGSLPDWSLAQNYPTNSGVGIDVYVMNKQGEVFRLPRGWGYNDRFNNRSGRRNYWKSSSCNWP